MGLRTGLLSSTFLASLAWLCAGEPAAAQKALPAVDGVNGKLEAFGGSYATKGLYGAAGSLSAPLADKFGVQIDVGGGAFASRFLGAVGGHLFWRDPRTGLIGLYGDYTRWNESGGIHVAHVGVEGEAYLGRFSLGGVAGVESGNNNFTSSSSTIAIPGPGTFTTTTYNLETKTRFFDRISLGYYFTDNWKGSVGHRYMGGKHALALGTEYAIPSGRGTMMSLFGEGRVGEGSKNYGVWGGLRVYFGNSDKTLIRRHREDDPPGDFTADTLFGLANGLPPTSNSATCPAGEFYANGQCLAGPI